MPAAPHFSSVGCSGLIAQREFSQPVQLLARFKERQRRITSAMCRDVGGRLVMLGLTWRARRGTSSGSSRQPGGPHRVGPVRTPRRAESGQDPLSLRSRCIAVEASGRQSARHCIPRCRRRGTDDDAAGTTALGRRVEVGFIAGGRRGGAPVRPDRRSPTCQVAGFRSPVRSWPLPQWSTRFPLVAQDNDESIPGHGHRA